MGEDSFDPGRTVSQPDGVGVKGGGGVACFFWYLIEFKLVIFDFEVSQMAHKRPEMAPEWRQCPASGGVTHSTAESPPQTAISALPFL